MLDLWLTGSPNTGPIETYMVVALCAMKNRTYLTDLEPISVFISIMHIPLTVHISHLITALEYVSEKCLHEGTSLYIVGDLNVNVLKHPNLLDDVLDILSLTNVVREPTCFKNVGNPTLIDLILTNTPRRPTTVLNVPLGISEFHNFICVATRMCKPTKAIRQITYRSYKRFNDMAYLHDLACAPFHVSHIFTDVDDQYWFFNTLSRPWINMRQSNIRL